MSFGAKAGITYPISPANLTTALAPNEGDRLAPTRQRQTLTRMTCSETGHCILSDIKRRSNHSIVLCLLFIHVFVCFVPMKFGLTVTIALESIHSNHFRVAIHPSHNCCLSRDKCILCMFPNTIVKLSCLDVRSRCMTVLYLSFTVTKDRQTHEDNLLFNDVAAAGVCSDCGRPTATTLDADIIIHLKFGNS